MDIWYEEKHSMDIFHMNDNIQQLVDICLEYYDTFVFDDIIGSITVKNKDSAVRFLNQAEIKYSSYPYDSLFFKFKQCILNLFDDSRIKNLKGAFLEVLSFKIFESLLNPHIAAKDCNVWIDGIRSESTVDIAMESEYSALICECKVPSSKFKGGIFKNLLDIISRSSNYYNAFAITLDINERMDSKKRRIKRAVPDADNIDEVICIYRENIGNYNSFLA